MMIGAPCLSDQRQRQGTILSVVIPVYHVNPSSSFCCQGVPSSALFLQILEENLHLALIAGLPAAQGTSGLDYHSFVDLLAVMDTICEILHLD